MDDRLLPGKHCSKISHMGQLKLAIPPWIVAMNTSESWSQQAHHAMH